MAMGILEIIAIGKISMEVIKTMVSAITTIQDMGGDRPIFYSHLLHSTLVIFSSVAFIKFLFGSFRLLYIILEASKL